MKRFISGIVCILLLLGMAYILPPITEFFAWLLEIDNADFGLPLWLDWMISGIAGVIAFAIVGLLSDALRYHDREAMSAANTIIGIIVGFVISLLVHAVLKYWYFILGGLCLLLAASITVVIVMKRKRKEK